MNKNDKLKNIQYNIYHKFQKSNPNRFKDNKLVLLKQKKGNEGEKVQGQVTGKRVLQRSFSVVGNILLGLSSGF